MQTASKCYTEFKHLIANAVLLCMLHLRKDESITTYKIMYFRWFQAWEFILFLRNEVKTTQIWNWLLTNLFKFVFVKKRWEQLEYAYPVRRDFNNRFYLEHSCGTAIYGFEYLIKNRYDLFLFLGSVAKGFLKSEVGDCG